MQKHKTEQCRAKAEAERSLSAGDERATTTGLIPAKIVKELKQRKLVEKEWLRHQSDTVMPWKGP